MKKIFLLVLALVTLSIITLYQCPYFYRKVDEYAIASTEERFGKERLAPAQESFIKDIAHEMGITQPFFIRTMNYNALTLFNYHNAFVYFPQFMYIIPLTDRPFLFVSEGFFEDLTVAEQRFLIGHEMVHLKERHTRYIALLLVMGILGAIAGWWRLRIWLYPKLTPYLAAPSLSLVFGILLFCSLRIPGLVQLTYRRHIEWQADKDSLAQLKSYDGGIKFMERLVINYRFPWHNAYGGWLADHPSCFERRSYCLACKQNAERIT